ncbi:MAG: helix-turn-helix transcriptional regulator [Spirochaetes bacterium]|nr:helix-turn-helix transcriptional regulator [Spirochaetota bacterium]
MTRNYLEDVRWNGFRAKSIPPDFRNPQGTLHTTGVMYKVCKSVKEPDGYLVLAREMGIEDLRLQGESNPDIASHLGISLRTVESHLIHIYNKCSSDNKIELFNLCRTYSLLPEPADTP